MNDNNTIEYRTGLSGIKNDRPTLVLVHGSGGSSLSWTAQINPLDRHMNVVAVSLPGHGGTLGPPLESIYDYAVWLGKTIEEFQLSKPLFLCGASLGGAVAIETILLRQTLFTGLILISTGAFFGTSVEIVGELSQNWPEAARRFIGLIFSDRVDSRTMERSYEVLLAAGPEILAADLAAGRNFDRRERLREIRIPALVIGGGRDRVTPPGGMVYLAKNLPQSRLVILEDSGHMVALEQHRRVNHTISVFVTNALSG